GVCDRRGIEPVADVRQQAQPDDDDLPQRQRPVLADGLDPGSGRSRHTLALLSKGWVEDISLSYTIWENARNVHRPIAIGYGHRPISIGDGHRPWPSTPGTIE